MNITPFPLNSREYHQFQASCHAAIAALYAGHDAAFVAYNVDKSNYHAAEALTAAPAQTGNPTPKP